MECCNSDPKKYFVCWMRLFFGIWLFYVGFVKWYAIGASAFVGMITTKFDPTWSPHILNVGLAWIILCAEPLLGLALLSGQKAREVWTLTALLMFMLTFGQTMLFDPTVVYNWMYTILALTCASLSCSATTCSEK